MIARTAAVAAQIELAMRNWIVLPIACISLALGCSEQNGNAESSTTVVPVNSSQTSQISAYPASPDEVAAGLNVVNNFLAALNRGEVSAGWSVASNELRAQMDEEKWKALIGSLFADAGRRGASQFRRVLKTVSLPNGPSGDIMIFGLVTQFEKKTIEETITLIKESGEWKLAAYNWSPRQ